MSLSSTCRQLRLILRPSLFASCRWKDADREPPETLWSLIRHLYINTDALPYVGNYPFCDDLSALESLHICAEHASRSLVHLLESTPHLHTLDLSQLCYKDDETGNRQLFYEPLPCLPDLPSHPSTLKFGSCLDRLYTHQWRPSSMYASKMHALRLPLAALLHDIGTAHLEHLELGAEALCLPFLAAYTWTSLRELVITGFWVWHPQGDRNAMADHRLPTPATAYAHVHLGTLLAAAPRLCALRVHCRFAQWLAHPQCVVWPASEPPPPSGSAVPLLDAFELTNPTAEDGIYAQLPPSLRTLSLLTWPHLRHRVVLAPIHPDSRDEQELLPPADSPKVLRTLTVAELRRVLGAAALPDLRQLRVSFRGPASVALFEQMAASFPCLELLEFHAESGPGKNWSADELAACARALSPLVHLRVLRADVFRDIYADDHLEEYLVHCDTQAEIDEVYAVHATWIEGRAGIGRKELVEALFGQDSGRDNEGHADCTQARLPPQVRLPALRQVWLPATVTQRHRNARWLRHIWYLYHVDRDRDGRADLRKDSGPHIWMVSPHDEEVN